MPNKPVDDVLAKVEKLMARLRRRCRSWPQRIRRGLSNLREELIRHNGPGRAGAGTFGGKDLR